MSDTPKSRKYKQTTLNGYFNISRKLNRFVELKLPKRGRRSTKTRTMYEHDEVDSNCNVSIAQLIVDISLNKPKIPYPILSDDEDDNDCQAAVSSIVDRVTTSTPKAGRMEKSPELVASTSFAENGRNTAVSSIVKQVTTSTPKAGRMEKSPEPVYKNCSDPLAQFTDNIRLNKPKIPYSILSDDEDDNNCDAAVSRDQMTTSTTGRMEKSPEPVASTSFAENGCDNDRTAIFNKTSSKSQIKILDNTVIKVSQSSPKKRIKVDAKIEKEANYHELNVMKQLLENVSTDNNINHLLTDDDKTSITKFQSMNTKYQYLVMKLFTWLPIWYNIFKFSQRINLSLTENEIKEMYHKLSDNSFVLTAYTDDNLVDILNNMEVKDLQIVSKKMSAKNVPLRSKDTIIKQLLKIASTQSTLSKKNMTDVIKKHCRLVMGYCVKLSDNCRDFLYKIYLLNTFTNPKFHQPRDYFSSLGYLNIKFPEFDCDEYRIFYVESEFHNYMYAVRCRLQIDKALENKNLGLVRQVCIDAFEKLQSLTGSVDDSRPPYLKRFSANYKYISIISSCCENLISQYHKDVRKWLKYFLSLDFYHHKRCFWYIKLSLIYTKYLKQYDRAASYIIDALKEKEHFSEIQIHELAKRGQLLHTKTYKTSRLYLDQLIDLSPESCDRDWPSQTIDKCPIRTNEAGKKRKYVEDDGNGGKTYSNVEQVAIDYYLADAYTGAEHFENSLIIALFNLFFWDIIYDNTVPGTLISKIQMWPLDFYTEYFYENRKHSIDQRLNQIASLWTDDEYYNFAQKMYDCHSHESSVCPKIDSIIKPVELLREILECIDRGLLMKIFKRLLINFKQYSSGLPDLFLWSLSEKRCKFVEVKGENDRLSIKQKLWLNYLMDNGADIEICHVHSTGSKKKPIVKKKSN